MSECEVRLWEMTRKEFREAIEDGRIKAAVVPVASTEQHHEHLAMIHDTASVLYVAEGAARKLCPNVVVATPVPIGVSEHWMEHKGTLTVRPEVFAQYTCDVCDSLKRAGVENILILNGHGGNVGPISQRMGEFRRRLGVNLAFRSYWDVYPKELVENTLACKHAPGHAGEFETAMGLALFPERVRTEEIVYDEAKDATAEKGRIMTDAAVEGVAEWLKTMMSGESID